MRAGFLTALVLGGAVAIAAPTFASVEISSSPTNNMNCTGGVCTPTAQKADLNATDLANMLATSDVKVVTGNGAVTITVTAPLSWTSSHRLTLDAYYNVSFKAPVEVAGQGAVTIVTNDGGTGGDLIFFPGGKLDFWDLSSSLIINGNTYSLQNAIRALATAVRTNPSGFFALAKDYDASKDRAYSKSPIKEIIGTFEGLGHSISNFSLTGVSGGKRHPPIAGLFKVSRGTLRDIAMLNTNVEVPGGGGGALVGENDGTIVQSNSTGTVSGGVVGGLVGWNSGTLLRCTSGAKVDGVYYSGGLVGRSTAGKILQSHATGSVNGTSAVGGLVGENDNTWDGKIGTIEQSYATGIVSAAIGVAGGLVGVNEGTISLSHSDSAIVFTGNFNTDAGGLVGWNKGGVISQSFSDGDLTATNIHSIGGLVALNDGTVSQSYSKGAVGVGPGISIGGLAGENEGPIGQAYAVGSITQSGNMTGGLVGLDKASGQIQDGYWDMDTTSISNPSQGAGSPANDPGITGLTDAQLKSGLPAGFDPSIWARKKKINNGYPYLINNPPPQ